MITIAADDLPDLWIVTLKYTPDKNHDPHNKKTGRCQLSRLCTDKTGAHHCVIVKAKSIEEVKVRVKHIIGYGHHVHFTRIEKVNIW